MSDKRRSMNLRIGVLLALGVAAPVLAQTPERGQPSLATPLPYTAVHQPQFVSAAEATFLQDDDVVLGVVSGTQAKAFPAADLVQHGAVSDRIPDGPISVTW